MNVVKYEIGVHAEQKSRMEEIEKKRLRRLDIIASRKRYQELHCQKQFEEAQCRLKYQYLVSYDRSGALR